MSALGGVHTLDLSNCLGNYSKITDVSALKDVPNYKGPNRCYESTSILH